MEGPIDDLQLIALAKSGNAEEFGRLVERYQRQVYYFVLGKVREHTEAQDIVQKSFITAYHNLATLVDDEAFLPWVRGIALNHCRNAWRRHHTQATMKERLLEAKRAELGMMWLEQESEGSAPRVEALRACMQRLSTDEQGVVERRFVQELSMEEIGAELNKGGEAVRLWLYRIRTRLAACVKRRLAAESNQEMA